MKLLIVESPTKANTINKYLGTDYKVIASLGHVRDLPSKKGSVLPEKDFSIKYELSKKSSKYVAKILTLAKAADEIYLATDPDREGESIAWHIVELLRSQKIISNDSKLKRITFYEITKKAIISSILNPRTIDMNLVNAQQTRRALDYLVGFTLSPILWYRLPGCKSAGRVQSVALRLICEREDGIRDFVAKEFWDITFDVIDSKKNIFTAKLIQINEKKLEKFSITNQLEANEIATKLHSQKFLVSSVQKKQQKRKSPPPFTTSSLQQEASKILGFSPKKTMQVAQNLYDGVNVCGEITGLITYTRTDGTTLADEAKNNIKNFIKVQYGANYIAVNSVTHKPISKNAQEAHEAIRPVNIDLLPESLIKHLSKEQFKLYDLIWKRTVASQMEAAIIHIITIDFVNEDKSFIARSISSTITFDGFLKVNQRNIGTNKTEEFKSFPFLKKGENITKANIKSEQHFTKPLPRYSEASIIKKLEELGIGRPSTYATIISVLQERKYVLISKKRFFPTKLGLLLTSFLTIFFKKYVDYTFTSQLEKKLDKIAEGILEWKDVLSKFWTGFYKSVCDTKSLKSDEVMKYLEKSLEHYFFGRAKELVEQKKQCPSCKDGVVKLKLSRFGTFFACSNHPQCQYKKDINNRSFIAEESILSPMTTNNTKELGINKDGEVIMLKKGPYGWYLEVITTPILTKKVKPRRVSLPLKFNPENLTLENALKLLNLPISIGNHPRSGKEIFIATGPFGPYIKYQNKFTSIPQTIDPFNITLQEAISLINKKK